MVKGEIFFQALHLMVVQCFGEYLDWISWFLLKCCSDMHFLPRGDFYFLLNTLFCSFMNMWMSYNVMGGLSSHWRAVNSCTLLFAVFMYYLFDGNGVFLCLINHDTIIFFADFYAPSGITDSIYAKRSKNESVVSQQLINYRLRHQLHTPACSHILSRDISACTAGVQRS